MTAPALRAAVEAERAAHAAMTAARIATMRADHAALRASDAADDAHRESERCRAAEAQAEPQAQQDPPA